MLSNRSDGKPDDDYDDEDEDGLDEEDPIEEPLLFLCGRVTGDDQKDREKFQHHCELLKGYGFQSMDPMELYREANRLAEKGKPTIKPTSFLDDNKRPIRIEYFLDMLESIANWDGIYLLPDWSLSYFSSIIMQWAKLVGLDIYYHDDGGNFIMLTNPQYLRSEQFSEEDKDDQSDQGDLRPKLKDEQAQPADEYWTPRTEKNPVEDRMDDLITGYHGRSLKWAEEKDVEKDTALEELGKKVEQAMKGVPSWDCGL